MNFQDLRDLGIVRADIKFSNGHTEYFTVARPERARLLFEHEYQHDDGDELVFTEASDADFVNELRGIEELLHLANTGQLDDIIPGAKEAPRIAVPSIEEYWAEDIELALSLNKKS